MDSTANIRVARDYFISKQNTVLIPNSDFGKRKFIHVGAGGGLKSPGRSKSLDGVDDIEPQITTMKSATKQWVHPPDRLLTGHIVYNVKFLGESEVESAKGTDVVKEAIRKRKFNKHIRKAEGQKTPKVELTISADGVTVQDPKSKVVMHQYPLHRISYCADDKTDKRMFTFIAKASDSNVHYCYVFDSEKCAEEITLTIGQAFDLAYRRFLETSGKDLDMKKQYILLQKKVQTLEQENAALKKRVQELEKLKGVEGTNSQIGVQPAVGRRLENLILEENTSQTNGTTTNGSAPTTPSKGLISPPPRSSRSKSDKSPTVQTNNGHSGSPNPFLSESSQRDVDPFGMPAFSPSTSKDLNSAITSKDMELMDIQAGFSAGLSFGTEDFSLADFDPLNQKS